MNNLYNSDDIPDEDFQQSESPGRYTVTDFTREIKRLIEGNIPVAAVEGEISNYIHHSSGHRYFTLKDENCQLKCVMFRWQAQGLKCVPEEGMKVLAIGNPTVYERGGQYQLTVFRLAPLGRGDLLARLEELKKKLAAEGLFDNQRPIPRYPDVVGVATSPTGAAVRDIVSVISRRAPHVRIVIRPTIVQGTEAAADIVRAISDLNAYSGADVIIAGRGGGSIEDLWCFNEETVARAIVASGIPVISAVGHETDFTLADFAADLRAPTPSAAAELAVRDAAELRDSIEGHQIRLKRAMMAVVDDLARRVDTVMRGLRHDRFLQTMMMRGQTVDELTLRLKGAVLDTLGERERTYERLSGKLSAMNPRSVLDRGYSIVFGERDGRVITDAAMVDRGDGIRVEVARGAFRARVED